MAESRRKHHHQPGWKGFRADWAKGWKRVYHRSSSRQKRFLFAVIALGVVLRILRMGAAITYDEALTYTEYVSGTFTHLFNDYTYLSNHILYSALAKCWVVVFGVHLWALRLPALLAGILVMPLGYAFAHRVFNRHIAAMFLCLLAVSGPLVEYSAMARGYSMVWFFTFCALLAARHFARSENMVSATVLALACALGMWASPSMVYPAIMVYIWAMGMVLTKYKSTVRRRLLKLIASLLMAFVLVVLFYTPLIGNQGLDQLLHHPSLAENTWKRFAETQQDRTFDIWAYFTDTTSGTIGVIGTIAVFYAAYMSVKYRWLVFAMIVAIFPLVLIQHVVAPPAVWTFTLLVFHLGMAIGLFYLLKTVRDKLAPHFAKGQRTLVGSAAVLLVYGWLGVMGQGDPVERYPETVPAAEWIKAHAGPKDRIRAITPWDAPLEFQLAAVKVDPAIMQDTDRTGGRLYLFVAPSHGQTPGGVMGPARMAERGQAAPRHVDEWGRLELYSVE